jgi:hypothetical protein
VSGGFPAVDSPRMIQLGIALYLSSQGGADPYPSPWPRPSALLDGASFILEDAAEEIKEDDLPFFPAAAEIQAAVSFNGGSLVRSSYANDPGLGHLVSVADLRRAPGLTALNFSWFAFGDAPSLGSLSPLEGEHPPSGSLSRESLAGKLSWGFIPRRDLNPALHTRDHDYRHSVKREAWVSSSTSLGGKCFLRTPSWGCQVGAASLSKLSARRLRSSSEPVIMSGPQSFLLRG